MSDKKTMGKKPFIALRASLLAVLLVVAIILNYVAVYWDKPLSEFLGSVGGTQQSDLQGDSMYFKSAYNSTEELLSAEELLCKQIAGEGTVLLKNNGALPLADGAKISLFGLSSSVGTSSGSGSGDVSTKNVCTWATAMQYAGFEINETLLQFYANSGHKRGVGTAAGGGEEMGDWKIDEVPQSKFTSEVKASYASYQDAAVVIFARGGGEGGDLPIEMSRHGGTAEEHYLELDANERDLLRAIQEAGFEKTIVIINCAAAMELGFVDQEEYGVDACLWVGGTGNNGLNAVGEILAGKINPSGRLVDTYVYDNFSAPSMQNFGDFRYVDSSGNLVGYSYINYAESIYVGYKYYETRYEDVVLGTENVGEYDYAATVVYPFGYGLSYTDFTWSDYNVTVENGTVTVSVTVTNSGDMAGKDVVEVYYQAPYTQYDRDNVVEKASANLVGFAKTGTLEPGAYETVTVTFDVSDMASYDYKTAKTYIMDEGTYYITAATDAHSAVNNILAAKGYSEENGMTAQGESGLVGTYKVDNLTRYDTAVTGAQVTNQFDDAILSEYTYLSRSNWAMMDDSQLVYATGKKSGVSNVSDAEGNANTIELDDATLKALQATGREATGAPLNTVYPDKESYTYGAENKIELVELFGKPYDDPMWDDLLNEMKLSEMHALFGKGGYGTIEIESINKPKTYEYDGPAGISNFITGQGLFSFPGEVTVAATWNTELAEELGKLIGEDGIRSKTSGWYAPAMNIHRTPFGGRNYEYYSEDSMLSGAIAANVTAGVQTKGVYVYIKHFALNDQETNRAANGSAATWSTEQAIREIYLKPFQIAVEEGNASGVMTSFNRIGTRLARGHYPLITNVLRGEWGFEGIVLTDYTAALKGGDTDLILAAGGDLILCTATSTLTEAKEDWCRADLRRAAHNVLYNIANSLAMNGLERGVAYSSGMPVYLIILIAVDVLVLLVLLAGIWSIVKCARMSEMQFANRKRMSTQTKRVVLIVAAVVLVALIVVFVIFVLPLIQKAFLM